MKNIILSIAILVFLAGVVANIYLWQKNKELEEQKQQTQTPEIIQEELVEESDFLSLDSHTEELIIQYPVPEEPIEVDVVEERAVVEEPEPVVVEEPLPALDYSDDSIQDALTNLLNPQQVAELFFIKAFVRHFVVTIDNMTNKKLPQRFVFTKKPAGKFAIKPIDDYNAVLDVKNHERYSPFVSLAEAVDNRQFVSFYVRYYPLFQGAYEDLGYPGRYFNDRLIEVINHLLETPNVNGPIKLVRPKVFYKFADPDLEALSAGQKILIRIGLDNAFRVKAKLRVFRQVLTTFTGVN